MDTQCKKKVLFLITKSNWGGAQRYVYDLATNLDKNHFTPVVTLGGEGELSDRLQHAGIRVIQIDSLTRDIDLKKDWGLFRTLWHILREEKPDVLHVNSSKAGGAGAFMGRILRIKKIVFTAHGWAFNEQRPWWQKFIIKFLHWLTVLFSHRTIAVSRAILEDMNWPIAQRKMKIINPGRTIGAMYSRSEAKEALARFYPKLEKYQNDPWLVCIAELHPTKQHHLLIQAFQEVLNKKPQARLTLIGDGQLRDDLQKEIENQNLSEHIFLLGALPDAARFLRAFDLFVLASLSEAYGYVLHEAALAKLPVIATNVGGVRDIVDDKQNGLLVSPKGTAELSEAILKLLTNTKYAQGLRDALYEKIQERTVDKMARATEAIYTL